MGTACNLLECLSLITQYLSHTEKGYVLSIRLECIEDELFNLAFEKTARDGVDVYKAPGDSQPFSSITMRPRRSKLSAKNNLKDQSDSDFDENDIISHHSSEEENNDGSVLSHGSKPRKRVKAIDEPELHVIRHQFTENGIPSRLNHSGSSRDKNSGLMGNSQRPEIYDADDNIVLHRHSSATVVTPDGRRSLRLSRQEDKKSERANEIVSILKRTPRSSNCVLMSSDDENDGYDEGAHNRHLHFEGESDDQDDSIDQSQPQNDFIDDSELTSQGSADAQRQLYETLDSDLRMTRTSKSLRNDFGQVLTIFLWAASCPEKEYPVNEKQSFIGLYPDTEISSLKKALTAVRGRVNTYLHKFSRNYPWISDFQQDIDSFSEHVLGDTPIKVTCEACGRYGTVTSATISFTGYTYRATTYEILYEDKQASRKQFLVGCHCKVRTSMYSRLKHYMFNLFMRCKERALEIQLMSEDFGESGSTPASPGRTKAELRKLIEQTVQSEWATLLWDDFRSLILEAQNTRVEWS